MNNRLRRIVIAVIISLLIFILSLRTDDRVYLILSIFVAFFAALEFFHYLRER